MVFAADDMDKGLFQGITHKENTGNAQPVRAKLRRTPQGFEKEEEARLKKNKLLDNRVIVPSNQNGYLHRHSFGWFCAVLRGL